MSSLGKEHFFPTEVTHMCTSYFPGGSPGGPGKAD